MITCTFENGNQAHLRHVTVGALVIKDGRILLVKRSPKLTNGNKYGLPGGYVDRDERIADGAVRELHEETGYETNQITLFLINDQPGRKQEDRQNIDFIYIIEPGKKTGEPDWESTSVDWYDLNVLPPESEFAFDHYDDIKRYREYLRNPVPLPILNFSYQ